MSSLNLTVERLTKEFNRRTIFRDISFSLSNGQSLAITGKNGSGKSTLVKILCGVLSPTKGTIEYIADGKKLKPDDVKHSLGLVSPYLQLYDEFTGLENLLVLSNIRSNSVPVKARAVQLLEQFGLGKRQDDYLRTYSSGMRQRLKYAFALLHQPVFLILDEPTSNLDVEGVELVKQVVEEQKRRAILIVATNDAIEASWCEKQVHLG